MLEGIIILVIFSVTCFVTYAICKAASRADEMEYTKEEDENGEEL